MIITTLSGSRYEIDGTRIRRLSGKNDPTPRIGKDGAWKEFLSIRPEIPQIGSPLMILWDPSKVPLLPENEGEIGAPMTLTSTVIEVIQ